MSATDAMSRAEYQRMADRNLPEPEGIAKLQAHLDEVGPKPCHHYQFLDTGREFRVVANAIGWPDATHQVVVQEVGHPVGFTFNIRFFAEHFTLVSGKA